MRRDGPRAGRAACALTGGLALLALAACSPPLAGGPEIAATDFFTRNAASPDAGYAAADRRFQSATAPRNWAEFSSAMQLGRVTGAAWSARSVTGDTATLHGALAVAAGAPLEATVDLAREGGAWKVDGVTVAAGDPSSSAAPPAGVQAPPADAAPSPAAVGGAADAGGVQSEFATVVTRSRLGAICADRLRQAGREVANVDCASDLPAQPGAVGHCVAHDARGVGSAVTVSVRPNASPGASAVDCIQE